MKMYTIDRTVSKLASIVAQETGLETAQVTIMAPKAGVDADLCFPCFALAGTLKKSSGEIATELSHKLQGKLPDTIARVEALGGYLNFKYNWTVFANFVFDELADGTTYGHSDTGKGQTVVVDLSAPNIAKPFSVGHLRSTVIGDALVRHFRAQGYTVIGDNHLGDWGTTFGKMIVALRHWGDRATIEKSSDPVSELTKLYVRFQAEIGTKEKNRHKGLPAQNEALAEQEDTDEQLDVTSPLMIEARDAALALEQDSPEEVALWKWFVGLSLKMFEKIYYQLGVKFDEQLGESAYRTLIPETIEWLKVSGILRTEPDSSIVVPLPDMDVRDRHGNTFETPLMVLKANSGTVYETRDLACALYREKRWQPAKIIYVVGSEQSSYFDKLFAGLKLAGLKANLVHTEFGMVLMMNPANEKWEKMSTRQGRVVLLEDLLSQAIAKAREVLDDPERHLHVEEGSKDEIAQIIGIGAIKFNDLGQARQRDVRFDWDTMLSLNGYSGPYLQYMAVRAKSVLAKVASTGEPDVTALGEKEWPLIELIARFPQVIGGVCERYEPHHMAQYLYELASAFGSYYDGTRIIDPETPPAQQNTRLHLVQAVGTVLEEGLRLLGIETPEKM